MNELIEPNSADTVTFQSFLRPALTPVLRNRDYDRLVEDLRQLDDNLTQGGLEEMAIRFGLSQLPPGASGAVRNRKAQFEPPPILWTRTAQSERDH